MQTIVPCSAVRPQDPFESSWEISTLPRLKEGGSSQFSSGRSPPPTSDRRSWRGGCNSDQGPITSLLSITILKRQMYWKPHRLYSDPFSSDRLYKVQTMTTSHLVSHLVDEVKDVDRRLNLVCFRPVTISTDSTTAGQKKQEPAGHQSRNLRENKQMKSTRKSNNQDVEKKKNRAESDVSVTGTRAVTC